MHPRSFPIPGCSCGAHGHRTTEVLILSRAEALLSRPFPCGSSPAAVRSPKSHSPGIRDRKRLIHAARTRTAALAGSSFPTEAAVRFSAI